MVNTAKIAHPKLDVSVFLRENKYTIKIVLDQYEQVFRINQSDVTGMDDIRALVNEEFLNKVYLRFVEMSKDFKEAFDNININ